MRNRATLLVDATNLYKIVFEGVKSYALQKQNLHAVWGFMKKLRGVLNENVNNHSYGITKTILFWDGPESGDLRRKVFPNYKEKRKRFFNGIDPYYQQKDVIKEMLSFLGITSYENTIVETDDCIAEYVRQNKSKENILILSNDHDYFQLIDKNVFVYYLNRIQTKSHIYPKNLLINSENFEYYFDYNPKNILMRKVIIGDESDNISGAKGFSEKSIISEIPMFVRRHYNRDELLQYSKERREFRKGKRLQILIDFLSDDYIFNLTESLIDLRLEKFITNECKQDIKNLQINTVDLKSFYAFIKKIEIHKQILTDLDFNSDYRFFLEPFLLTKK